MRPCAVVDVVSLRSTCPIPTSYKYASMSPPAAHIVSSSSIKVCVFNLPRIGRVKLFNIYGQASCIISDEFYQYIEASSTKTLQICIFSVSFGTAISICYWANYTQSKTKLSRKSEIVRLLAVETPMTLTVPVWSHYVYRLPIYKCLSAYIAGNGLK